MFTNDLTESIASASGSAKMACTPTRLISRR
jgi:hypothetical protein